jgi:hypothetical protein
MKVKDAIKELEKLDPEMEIYIPEPRGGGMQKIEFFCKYPMSRFKDDDSKSYKCYSNDDFEFYGLIPTSTKIYPNTTH